MSFLTDIYVLDTNYNIVGILDNYNSAIFTKRYWECGDFELYIKANKKSLELLKPNYFVKYANDTYIYVIESIQLSTNQEDGDFLTIKGRSAESILDRRILYNHRAVSNKIGGFMVTYPTGSLIWTVEDCIRNALEMTIAPINPTEQGYLYDWYGNFVLGKRQGFTEIMPQTQLTGVNLYDFVTEQCKKNNYGMRVHLNDNKNFEFNLYRGRDCSYNQKDNPYLIFSTEFGNLLNTNYIFNNTNFKSHIITAGEGDGDNRLWIERYRKDTSHFSNINRREVFLDNKSVSSDEVENYIGLLNDTAEMEIIKYNAVEELDGEVTSIKGMEYQLGDIVQITNEYGLSATAKILEIIECENETGYSIIPTFDTWEVS